MLGHDIQSSPRTHSFATAADLADADGIKTSVATDDEAASYSGAALNGAFANPGPAEFDPPRFFSVSTTTDAATYNTTDPIVVTGTYGGEDVTEEIMLTQAGGNETVIGNQPFDSISQIDVPAQLTTDGAFTFGVSGIAAKKKYGKIHPFRQVRAIGAGNLKLGFTGGFTDTLVLADAEKDQVEPLRVYAVGTTCGVRLYE